MARLSGQNAREVWEAMHLAGFDLLAKCIEGAQSENEELAFKYRAKLLDKVIPNLRTVELKNADGHSQFVLNVMQQAPQVGFVPAIENYPGSTTNFCESTIGQSLPLETVIK
jgi:hypothetical protein